MLTPFRKKSSIIFAYIENPLAQLFLYSLSVISNLKNIYTIATVGSNSKYLDIKKLV